MAARRALKVTGTGDRLTEPGYVAEFSAVANIAVGDETPWGIAAGVTRLVPGTEAAAYTSESADPAAEAVAAAGERRIVAVVRDEHRHAWMGEALDALLAARPDTIVVEMGVPESTPRGALHIATHGASRVCGQAAAEAVTGA